MSVVTPSRNLHNILRTGRGTPIKEIPRPLGRGGRQVQWNFVKGWTATPNARSTNARLDYVWLDLPELPQAR